MSDVYEGVFVHRKQGNLVDIFNDTGALIPAMSIVNHNGLWGLCRKDIAINTGGTLDRHAVVDAALDPESVENYEVGVAVAFDPIGLVIVPTGTGGAVELPAMTVSRWGAENRISLGSGLDAADAAAKAGDTWIRIEFMGGANPLGGGGGGGQTEMQVQTAIDASIIDIRKLIADAGDGVFVEYIGATPPTAAIAGSTITITDNTSKITGLNFVATTDGGGALILNMTTAFKSPSGFSLVDNTGGPPVRKPSANFTKNSATQVTFTGGTNATAHEVSVSFA